MVDRPEHIKCSNCIFYEPYPSGRGDCLRFPPKAGASRTVLHALMQIHWVVSEGCTKYADEQSANEFHPETASSEQNDSGAFPIVYDDGWCGEFKASW